MIPTDNIASALLGFSSLSFVIFFGTATFIPMTFELTIKKESSRIAIELLSNFPYRLVMRLKHDYSVFVLLVISLSFAVVSFLTLLYCVTNEAVIIESALWIATILSFILIIFFLIIFISAYTMSQEEIKTLLNYIPDNK